MQRQDRSSPYQQLLEPGETSRSGDSSPASLTSSSCTLPVFLPTGSIKKRWDFLVLLLILYSGVMVPVRVCFAAEADGFWWYLEMVTSLCFCADVLCTFNTAVLVGDGANWIVDRGVIARNYLSGWFWVDAPSSLPFELFELLLPAGKPGEEHSFRVLRTLRVLRILRLMRLLRLDVFIARLEEQYDVNLRALRLVSLLIKVFFAAHMFGCTFFFFGAQSEDGWVAVYDGGEALDSDVYVHRPHTHSRGKRERGAISDTTEPRTVLPLCLCECVSVSVCRSNPQRDAASDAATLDARRSPTDEGGRSISGPHTGDSRWEHCRGATHPLPHRSDNARRGLCKSNDHALRGCLFSFVCAARDLRCRGCLVSGSRRPFWARLLPCSCWARL